MPKTGLLFFCALALCFAGTLAQFAENNSVVILNNAHNLKQAQEHFPILLVYFYKGDKNINETQKFEVLYQQIAVQMKDNTPPITFAQLDIRSEKNITEKYQLKDTINIRLMLNQTNRVLNYKGEQNQTSLMSWLQRVSMDISQEINEKQELKQIQKEHDVVLMYFGESELDKEYQVYENIAYEYNDLKFIHTFSSNLMEEFNAKPHSVVLYKTFDDKKKQVLDPKQITEQQLKVFIDKNSYPEILLCNKRSSNRIYEQNNPTLFLFTDNSEKGKEVDALFRTVAQKNKGKILYMVLYENERMDSVCYNESVKLFGVKQSEIPTVRILGFSGRYQVYKLEEELNQKNLESFITKFRVKRLKSYYRSDPIPDEKEQADRLIKVVVTDNYVKEVIESDKDVVVVFTSPTCEMCKQYLPTFENITRLNPGSNLMFVTCDTESNDIQHLVNVQNLPTIKLYLAGKKKNPIQIPLNSVFWAEEIAKLLSYKIKIKDDPIKPETNTTETKKSDL